MIRLIMTLCVCTLLSVGVQASESTVEKIKQLTRSGQLVDAYRLAQSHAGESDAIALQYGQLAMLLGRERQAERLFERLKSSPQLSDLQKQNMDLFVTRFKLSLQKKLKTANQLREQGRCDQASVMYRGLLQYESIREYIKDGVDTCSEFDKANQDDLFVNWGGAVEYRLGYDSNIKLENEELLAGQSTLEDFYHVLSGYVRTQSFAVSETPYRWQPIYSFYNKYHNEENAAVYDQINHQLEVRFSGLTIMDWKLRAPVSYRWSALSGDPYAWYGKIGMIADRRLPEYRHRMSVGWEMRRYLESRNEGRDGSLYDIEYSLERDIEQLELGVDVGYNLLSGLSEQHEAYGKWTWALSLEQKQKVWLQTWRLRMALYARVSGYQSEFAESDPALVAIQALKEGDHRADSRTDAQIGAKFYYKKWRARVQYAHQTRDSNVTLYDYDRSKVELGLQYRF